jgi:hypothetical protein
MMKFWREFWGGFWWVLKPIVGLLILGPFITHDR